VSLTVGLTGGIASGKSLVAELFRQHGVHVIDADQLAREVVAPGQPGLARLVAHFGPDILDARGSLERRRMRERVFTDAEARRQLEAILHPLIHAELARQRDADGGEYSILMIPLLARSGMRVLVDRILVVDAPETTQIERLRRRDNISNELALNMLSAQETRQQRLDVADDILLNSGDASLLEAPVAQLHLHYLKLARGQASPEQRLRLPASTGP
jgi:dephospho-CoA kinase